MFTKSVAILGGDRRQISLGMRLSEAGLSVRISGLPRDGVVAPLCFCERWQEAAAGAVAVILPLPATQDGKHISMPLLPDVKAPRLDDVLSFLPAGTLLTGGKLDEKLQKQAYERCILCFDYFTSEELQQKNALPTAEGALMILMEKLPRIIRGAKIAVVGYGRVGQALAQLLVSVGAEVTVTARRREMLAKAEGCGCQTILIENNASLLPLAAGYHAICNTVPHCLFDDGILRVLCRDTLLMELASSPGGIDAKAAQKHNVSVIYALSLPGKYAPVTAGEIIADTVLSKLYEEGVI